MKESKKVLRQTVEDALKQAILKFDVQSKKTEKLIKGAAKKISEQIKTDLKRKRKKKVKLAEPPKKSVKRNKS